MKIFDISLRVSRELNRNNCKTHRHFAFIINRNKILSIGENQMDRTSYFTYKIGKRFSAEKIIKFPYYHAEINAISKMWGREKISRRMTIISIRLNRFGDLLKSDPCESCRSIIDGLGLKVIYYDGKTICKN